MKETADKVQWSLLLEHLSEELEQVVRAFEEGEKKYARDDWMQSVAESPLAYWDALFRHAIKAINEDKDADSDLDPLAHVIACALILMWHTRAKLEEAKEDV